MAFSLFGRLRWLGGDEALGREAIQRDIKTRCKPFKLILNIDLSLAVPLMGSSMISYIQELVSQCLPHAADVLWALLCVCGASVEHLHPRDRLRKKDKISFCISLP